MPARKLHQSTSTSGIVAHCMDDKENSVPCNRGCTARFLSAIQLLWHRKSSACAYSFFQARSSEQWRTVPLNQRQDKPDATREPVADDTAGARPECSTGPRLDGSAKPSSDDISSATVSGHRPDSAGENGPRCFQESNPPALDSDAAARISPGNTPGHSDPSFPILLRLVRKRQGTEEASAEWESQPKARAGDALDATSRGTCPGHALTTQSQCPTTTTGDVSSESDADNASQHSGSGSLCSVHPKAEAGDASSVRRRDRSGRAQTKPSRCPSTAIDDVSDVANVLLELRSDGVSCVQPKVSSGSASGLTSWIAYARHKETTTSRSPSTTTDDISNESDAESATPNTHGDRVPSVYSSRSDSASGISNRRIHSGRANPTRSRCFPMATVDDSDVSNAASVLLQLLNGTDSRVQPEARSGDASNIRSRNNYSGGLRAPASRRPPKVSAEVFDESDAENVPPNLRCRSASKVRDAHGATCRKAKQAACAKELCRSPKNLVANEKSADASFSAIPASLPEQPVSDETSLTDLEAAKLLLCLKRL